LEEDYHQNSKNCSAEDISWIVKTQVHKRVELVIAAEKNANTPKRRVAYPDQGRQIEEKATPANARLTSWSDLGGYIVCPYL
jgi:hypothetical protein